MNMRESIARKAFTAWRNIFMIGGDYDQLTELDKESWLFVADDILDALMKPTGGMILAGLSEHQSYDDGHGGTVGPEPDDVERAFTAAIRAAKEGK